MNYFEFYSGDYSRDTAHLSLAEHGAFLMLLSTYYSTERPLPADHGALYRIARAMSSEEQAAVRMVADEFFPVASDGLRHNGRADDEIVKARKRIENARGNGKKGGRPRKTEPKQNPAGNPEETQRVSQNETQQEPTGKAPQTPHAISKAEEQKPLVQRSAARFDEFWAAYPEKKGKAAAMKAWKVKGCDAIADQIIAHVHRMLTEDRGWRDGYVPHGSTYVNGERWTDEPKGRSTGPPVQSAPSKTLTAIKQLEAMKHGLAGNRDPDRIPEAALLGPGAHSGD